MATLQYSIVGPTADPLSSLAAALLGRPLLTHQEPHCWWDRARDLPSLYPPAVDIPSPWLKNTCKQAGLAGTEKQFNQKKTSLVKSFPLVTLL